MRPALWLSLALLAGCAAPRPGPAAGPGAGDAPLAVTDLDGGRHDLEQALERGEHVALVFWQTWCASCREEAPAVAAAAREHGQGLRFVGVVPGRDDVVDDAEVRATIAAWGYGGFPQVRDRDLRLTRLLDVRGTPTIVVLARGRRVLYRGHRPPASWQALRGAAPAAPSPGASAAGDAQGCEDGVCPLPPPPGP